MRARARVDGRPIARSLLGGGYDVHGWNRSSLDAPLTAGIPLCVTMAAAAEADVSLLVLTDSDAVDAVLRDLEPLLRPGQVVVDMGTSDPARSSAHAERLATSGIGWVDAPVSGGPEGAETRRLAIMAGGTEDDCRTVEPLLSSLGGFVRVGGAGAGHTVKLVNQGVELPHLADLADRWDRLVADGQGAADCAALISLLTD